MIDAKRLLSDLTHQLKKLEDDLRRRIGELPELREALQREWQSARDANRCAETFESWSEQLITQAGVHWLLSCVFLRFIEDNELVERPWLSGTAGSGRLTLARDRAEAWFRARPLDTDRDYLLAAGYAAEICASGEGVVERVRAQVPAAILLDINLPGMDGLSICRELRRFSDVPILMLTARVEELDRLLGLELGADDYICKPFSPREVVARVRAVLRRVNTPAKVREGAVVLDEERFEARIHGIALTLTPVEFRLLGKLSGQPGRVFSRAQLIGALYADHRVVSDRTVDSHVKNLRRKLVEVGIDPISAVYGVGYRFELDDDAGNEA